MIVFLISLAFIAVVSWYVLWGRSWLKAKPWGWSVRFFALVEPVEIFLWKKSETILKARLQMLIGVLLTFLTQLGAIDLTPLMPFVPDEYQLMVRVAFNMLPMVLTILGMMDERLRNDTNKPLEIVALPEAAIAASPVLQQVVAKAEEVKVEAKVLAPEVKAAEAIVVEAKKEGAS